MAKDERGFISLECRRGRDKIQIKKTAFYILITMFGVWTSICVDKNLLVMEQICA